MKVEDYEDGNEEVVDMSGYDFDSPIEYDRPIKPFVPTEPLVKRSCHNKECTWEGLLNEDIRLCPGCGYEIKGWKSKALSRLPVYPRGAR